MLYIVISYIWLGKQKIRPLAFILSKLEANLYLRCIMYDNFIYLKPVKFMFYKKWYHAVILPRIFIIFSVYIIQGSFIIQDSEKMNKKIHKMTV